MPRFVVGRLFGWPEFAEDGDDIWLVHLDEPAFFLRVVHRPEDLIPTGDLADMYFPLEDDARYAVGNLMFVEPRTADPSELAQTVAQAIEATHDPDLTERIGLGHHPFNPSSAELLREDIPLGFLVGAYFDSDSEVIDDLPWAVHLGPPPFAMRVCDLNDEDLEPDDIWATVSGGYALAHLHWLSSMASEREDIRVLAETAAGIVRDAVDDVMPELLPD
ncbi:MAG: hypothetical protein JJ899_04305 [Alphaproteobacteria bacterium]|nr:hypothetical protein [Alphaproteobacteria bacterium]